MPEACSIDVPEDPHRQPRRDRAPHPARLPRAGHSRGRRAFHADADAMHVRLADESVCIGPPPAKDSYLNIPAILSAAPSPAPTRSIPATASCPRTPRSPRWSEAHGLTFIGPSAAHIRMMGDKIAAKVAMAARRPAGPRLRRRGCAPTKPRDVAERIGYPVLVKAAAGGGGRGMKVARDAARWRRRSASPAPKRERRSAMTRCTSKSISTGRAISNCRCWRRSWQGGALRRARLQPATAAPEAAGGGRLAGDHAGPARPRSARPRPRRWRNSATATPARWSSCTRMASSAFIEMNTRLQVEHPVTEMVCGIDLVREQIRIAAGAQLGYGQADIRFSGHAIECRITRRTRHVHADAGAGHRVPCAGRSGRARRSRRCTPAISCRRTTTAWWRS